MGGFTVEIQFSDRMDIAGTMTGRTLTYLKHYESDRQRESHILKIKGWFCGKRRCVTDVAAFALRSLRAWL